MFNLFLFKFWFCKKFIVIKALLSLELGIWFELDLIKRFVYLWCSKKHKNLHFFNSLLSFCLFFTKFLVRYVIITIMIMIDRYSFEIWCSIDSCSSIYKKSSIIKREALAIISFSLHIAVNLNRHKFHIYHFKA